MSELTDDEIDKIIKEEINPDIIHDDSISEDVDEHLSEMGFLWDVVRNKLEKDKVCFACKKPIDLSTEKMHVIEATKTENGVVAFVSLCESCYKKAGEDDNRKDARKKD